MMDPKKIDEALYEYDSVCRSVEDVNTFGFEFARQNYEKIKKMKKHKVINKSDVMFQTEFLEKTYSDFLYNEGDVDSTIANLGVWYHGLIRSNIETIDWYSVIYNTNGNNLEEVINLHHDNISDEIYWKIIGHCYTSSELGHSDSEVIAGYLNNNRSNRHYLMNEEERNLLANLPDQVTIYRGCSTIEANSTKLRFSWTLDREIAESFANDYTTDIYERLEGKDKSKYVVIERVIKKDEIVAYFIERNESEIIYFPKN